MLSIAEDEMQEEEAAFAISDAPAIVITGNEDYYGLIKDAFALVIAGKIKSFDEEVDGIYLVLQRVLAGERIGRRELAKPGHGGLCMKCEVCRYPVCPFGKG